MDDTRGIEFDDLGGGQTSWSSILKEAQARGLATADVPPAVQERVRLEQIHALRTNVAMLKHKQEEFNARIEAYTGEIEKLVSTIAAMPKTDLPQEAGGAVLVVRCVGCGREREFPGFSVLRAFAPESPLDAPTELWVHTEEGLRRGAFRCPECGPSSLAVKIVPQPGAPRPQA